MKMNIYIKDKEITIKPKQINKEINVYIESNVDYYTFDLNIDECEEVIKFLKNSIEILKNDLGNNP